MCECKTVADAIAHLKAEGYTEYLAWNGWRSLDEFDMPMIPATWNVRKAA